MPNIFNLSIPQLTQWSRRQLPDHRRLNEPVEAINRMTTGIGLPSALHKVHRPLRRIVVLIKEPNVAEDEWLNVRAVRYLDSPPIPLSPIPSDPPQLRVSYATDAFRAYPKIGYTIADFLGSAFADIDDAGIVILPDLTTVFLDAYLDHGFWVVSPPATRERFVVCRKYLDDDTDGLGRMLIVQEVMPELDVEDKWTGRMQVSSVPIEMNIWPFMKAADFAPFLWYPAELNDFTTILPITFWHGAWWLKQRPKKPVSIRRGPLQLVDCQP